MPITRELVENAIAVMKKDPANYIYFFDNLKSAKWIEPLRERGFFKVPPDTLQEDPPKTILEIAPESGTMMVSFPPWPESRYLARVAGVAPDCVLKVMLELAFTDNASVRIDLAEAACAMPASLAAKWARREAKWVAKQKYLYLLLPDRLGKLVTHLVKGEETQAALALARSILDINPPADPGFEDADGWPDARARPLPRCEKYDYEGVLESHIPQLVNAAGQIALIMLCQVLNSALTHVAAYQHKRDQAFSRAFDSGETSHSLPQPRETSDLKDDSSESWRPHIQADSGFSPDAENLLVTAIRDAAAQLIASRQLTVHEAVKLLERYSWKVFHRISLHVLRSHPDSAAELIVKRLTNAARFGYDYLPPEYDLLLKDFFPHASAEARQDILRFVEQRVSFENLTERYGGSDGFQSEEDTQVQVYRWKIERLHAIHAHLSPRWQRRYAELAASDGLAGYKVPDPEHVWTPVANTPGSPKSQEELARMTVGEIVAFLKTWESASWHESPNSLGRDLSSLAEADPQRFAKNATAFKGLDATYVREVIWGLWEALKNKRDFDWGPVLELCEWVVAQPYEIPGRDAKGLDWHKDPHWGWSFKAVADLIHIGLEARECTIPFAFRARVWQMIAELAEDSELTPEHEAKYHTSPADGSINTTRGVAMHAVIEYALWVRRNIEKEPESVWRGFEHVPEVETVLEQHLEPSHDPALAVRAVYGQHTFALDYLDREWTAAHVPRIFPHDEASKDYWSAAWDSFIRFAEPNADLFHRLEGEYRHAIAQLDASADEDYHRSRSVEKLAEELMLFYWNGELDSQDQNGLLSLFYEKTPSYLRAHAIESVGRMLQSSKNDVSEEVVQRLKRLWISRLKAAREADEISVYQEELAAFGWWFASERFEENWALERLTESIEIGKGIEDKKQVVAYLTTLAVVMPHLVALALRLIVESASYSDVYLYSDEAKEVLQSLLASDSKEARGLARRTIDRLLSLGHRDFRDLVRSTTV